MGLLDIIFTTDNTEKKKEETVAPNITFPSANVQPQVVTLNNTTVVTPTSTPSNAVMEEYKNHFTNLYEKANLVGPDYNELDKARQSFSTLDEATAFQVAFTSLSTMGLTKDKLNTSLDTYISIIEKDKVDFEAALSETYKNTVESKKKEILNDQNKLVELTKQIEAINTRLNASQAEINTEEINLANSKANYQNAFDEFVNKLKTDKVKINQYIK